MQKSRFPCELSVQKFRKMLLAFDPKDTMSTMTAPENVPVPPPAGVQQQDCLLGEWGSTTLCHCRAEDRRFENPKLLKRRPDSRLGWFRYYLPMKYITGVLLVETSKVLPGKPLTLG
jgi:hypothetical protein